MKGAFFTVTALLLASFAAISVLLLMHSTQQYNEGIQTRVITLNNFLEDSQKDFERALQIGTIRGLLALSDEVVVTGEYIQDFNESFEEMILNGTYKGEEVALMSDTTLDTWIDRVQTIADKSDIGISFTIQDISIEHDTPWSVETYADVYFVVWDKNGLANFSSNYQATGRTSILAFEDPYYLIGSLGRVSNTIIKSNLTSFVSGEDTSNLMSHINNGHYINNSDAPSYLYRLQGSFEAHPQGIESLVDLSKLSDQGLAIYVKSIADHIYFGSENPTPSQIQNTPDWVRLDEPRFELYEVEDLV